ncbi:transmembrane protein 180-like [Anneissia japonica]|uniref:transmembrane protein 180-like n=1 Tax=Anneissia japonica TaxID=1529436 RepID=UPI0014255411|nr:transmembrane protein 180-like [Anneissia japonica]
MAPSTRRTLHLNAFAYSLTTFGASLMTGVFSFYYVKLFLNKYGISESWFQISQVIYLLWNAINDPLFAYLQDSSNIAVFRQRKLSILYGAPIFVISFLFPWFPWRDYEKNDWLCGVHLMVTLSFYDALFTFVLLAQCALFAEISTKYEDRILLTNWSQIAKTLGASSVFFTEFFSDSMHNFRAFQMCCVVIALISWLAMTFSARNVHTHQDAMFEKHQAESLLEPDNAKLSIFQCFKQICCDKNFLSFIATNFLMVFHLQYLVSFIAILGDQLIPDEDLSNFSRKSIYGSTQILPQILVLLLSSTVARIGYYRVMLYSFYSKLILSSIMFLIGPQHTWFIALFLLFDSGFSNAVFNFANLPLSDIIDEDQQRYNRKSPLSSSVFGFNALFTKPAQSFAPMLIVSILNNHGYNEMKDGSATSTQLSDLRYSMFCIVCFIPTVIAVLQVLVWKPYSLRASHKVIPVHLDS